MYLLRPLKPFNKRYEKLTFHNQKLKLRIARALDLMMQNPKNSSLRSHKVQTKKFGVCWSSRVTKDIRIIWKYDRDNNLVILILTIGGHTGRNKVYK